MTKQDFDEAVEHLRREGFAIIETEAEQRVFIAIGLIMRNRRSLPDDRPWGGPTDAELVEFLADLSRAQRKSLKKIADSLKREVVSVDEYLTEIGQADRSIH